MSQPIDLRALLAKLQEPPKRKIFISYHHHGDQQYYELFSQTFADTYDVIYDNSLERIIDSDNVDYVMQRIRDTCISGCVFR